MIHLGRYVFDHVVYDAESDVLYMSIGEPRPAHDGSETSEGHAVRFGEDNEVIGVTIVSAKRWLDLNGKITVSLPGTLATADTEEIEAALTV